MAAAEPVVAPLVTSEMLEATGVETSAVAASATLGRAGGGRKSLEGGSTCGAQEKGRVMAA